MRRLHDYWPLLAALLAGAAGVGAAHVQILDTKAAVGEQSSRQAELEQRVARVEEAISTLPEIRKDIKELLRRR